MTTTPSLSRTLLLLTAGAALLFALAQAPIDAPPLHAGDVVDWWASTGTEAATVAIVRMIAMLLAGAVTTLALVSVPVAARPRAVRVRRWARRKPTSLRRVMVVSTAVATTSTITAAGAAEPVAEPAILVDLGPSGSGPQRPTLEDLGPVDPPPPEPDAAPAAPVASAPPAEQWTVQRGDHLWRIADETLTDRGEAHDDEAVLAYWQELIDTNRDAIGDDLDLIHPGLVLQLPG